MTAMRECGARLRHVWRRAGRQKEVEGEGDAHHTSLRRCLSTLQMTAVGLGSTIGVGIYVLLGVAIRDYAGPGVVLSFLGAGLVVLTNAVIFAEFGSYIPHTGAAYTYMYWAVGELAAFLTGWMGLFSLTCSAATGARAWSGFVDSLFNNSIQTFLDSSVGQLELGPPFARSLDWMAFTFFLVLTLVVSCNVQCSSFINTVLAVLTTGVLVFIAIAGLIVGDLSRLADPDNGGFLPYGMSGVVTGASAAFFAFNGFDSICISAEEAKDPVKSVPRAILIELLIVTVVYSGAAVGTVCLIPYKDIDLRAPIPSAFAYQGMTWARIIVTVGPVIAMTNLSLMSLYAQSRIFYRMAKDGLLFRRFAHINPVTKVPLLGVVVCGVMVAVISLLLELKDLVRFSVLCMLFQYIVLAPALINLRARDQEKVNSSPGREVKKHHDHGEWERDPPLSRPGQTLSMDVGQGCVEYTVTVNEEENESPVDDGSPGQVLTPTPRGPQTSATYSYVTAGDLGSGTHPEGHHELGELLPGSKPVSANSQQQTLSAHSDQQQHGNTPSLLVDIGQGASSEFSQSEDGTTITTTTTTTTTTTPALSLSSSLRNRNLDPSNSELADESHFSEESSFQTRNGSSEASLLHRSDRKCGVFGGGGGGMREVGGCFDVTMGQFFKLLTTRRCLVLLVFVLAALALQLGLAWRDLRDLRLAAVVSVVVLVIVTVFLCEVLRKRCGPGRHEGFKVPMVPYVPAASCFLNMLLLVTAADYLGIIEFAVLVTSGLVVYVVMVMTQWSREDGASTKAAFSVQAHERRNLLAHEENDADSEGSL
ncbi:cationic amino acid transporter 4-like [Babylonia areolata]|uniref:cationic amino acid transporter 4-like n=1 Tax=Babylonia areolata TaxID=304850 RepID=UPI003FD1A6BD